MSNINLYNIDNMEFMKNIPDNYYDLAIVDPPYGLGIDGQKENKKGKKVTESFIKVKIGIIIYLKNNISMNSIG